MLPSSINKKPAYSTSRFGYDRDSIHLSMEFFGVTGFFSTPKLAMCSHGISTGRVGTLANGV
jgi:hypothetical protein